MHDQFNDTDSDSAFPFLSPPFPQLLGDMLDHLVQDVARVIHAQVTDLRSRRRTQHLALQRAVAIYIVRRIGRASLNAVGRAFGRHHSTIHYACRSIERRIAHETGFRLAVERFIEQITETMPTPTRAAA